MTKPVRIEFLAEVASYLREVKKMEISTEDVEEALVATTHSSDDLERKLSRAMRDAAKDTEVLERAVKEIPKATDHMADEAVRDFDRVGDEAKDSGKEAGRNFAQSLGEGLGSGDTSEVVQEVLGEMVGNITGPAGAAVAAGAAIALALFNSFRADAEKQKEVLATQLGWYDLLTGELDKIGQFQDTMTELGGGDFGTGLKDAREYARLTGLSFDKIAQVISGEINPGTEDTYDFLKQQLRAMEDQESQARINGETMTTAFYDQKNAVEEVLKTADLERDIFSETKGIVKTTTDYLVHQGEAHRNVSDYAKLTALQTRDIANNVSDADLRAQGLSTTLNNFPKQMTFKVKLDTSDVDSYSGGAFATSAGGRMKVYGTRPGQAG